MTEFAVGAATLGLLMLGALTLAGLQEVDRRAVTAARQVAWQQSWHGAGVDAEALHRDFFADSGVVEPSGRRLMVEREALVLDSRRRAPGGVAGAAAEILLAPLRVSSGFLGTGLDLAERGLVAGTVRATAGPLPGMSAPFDSLELELRSTYALLGDAWHAGGVQHVRNRADALVPSSQLTAFSSIWRPLSVPLSILEPSLQRLCFGLIEPDRIPEDRLGPGRTPLPQGCP